MPTTFAQMVLVGSGGFAGAVGRYLLGLAVPRWFPAASAGFPLPTVLVNLAGCLGIGLLGGLLETRGLLGTQGRLLLLVGLLGGFTTYSTFAWETLSLLREGHAGRAVLLVLIHVVGGILAAGAGFMLVAPR